LAQSRQFAVPVWISGSQRKKIIRYGKTAQGIT
jgi:hypothetical protein